MIEEEIAYIEAFIEEAEATNFSRLQIHIRAKDNDREFNAEQYRLDCMKEYHRFVLKYYEKERIYDSEREPNENQSKFTIVERVYAICFLFLNYLKSLLPPATADTSSSIQLSENEKVILNYKNNLSEFMYIIKKFSVEDIYEYVTSSYPYSTILQEFLERGRNSEEHFKKAISEQISQSQSKREFLKKEFFPLIDSYLEWYNINKIKTKIFGANDPYKWMFHHVNFIKTQIDEYDSSQMPTSVESKDQVEHKNQKRGNYNKSRSEKEKEIRKFNEYIKRGIEVELRNNRKPNKQEIIKSAFNSLITASQCAISTLYNYLPKNKKEDIYERAYSEIQNLLKNSNYYKDS